MAARARPAPPLGPLVNVVDPAQAADEVARVNERIAGRAELSDVDLRAVAGVIKALGRTDLSAWHAVDPYLVGVCVKAVAELSDGALERDRRSLRVGLARLEHALRELAERRPVAPDRSPKEVVRWLVDHSDVSQRELAELVRVAPRTFQRWASTSEPAAPGEEQAARIRVVAAALVGLRHVLTPSGAIRWFGWPSRYLDDAPPRSLLTQPDRYGELLRAVDLTRAGDFA
jgi:hypothetical protein